jgi:hypothetical protein
MKYRIASRLGDDFGIWEGESPEAAFLAMVAECGDGDDADGNSTAGDWTDWIIEPADDQTV